MAIKLNRTGLAPVLKVGENTSAAVMARQGAEAAAAAALAATGAPAFANTAAGLAGVEFGETFYVVAAGVGVIYRKDAGPVATEIGRFIVDPSAPGAAALIGTASGGSVQDSITFVTPKMFGAIGDGVADDRAAFVAALALNPGELRLGNKHYAVSQGIELPSNIVIRGSGRKSRITSTGTNKRVFWAEGKENILIEGVFIEGNLTGGTYNPATGDTGGDGVFFRNCQDVAVRNCLFDKIGQDTTAINVGANCVAAMLTDSITVAGCTFLENNISVVGADVSVSYYVKGAIVVGNTSRSEHDHFFSGPAVGITEFDTSFHVVADNIIRRSLNTKARSGIIANYARGAYASITGNVITGFNWNAIYVAAPQDDQNGSGVTVAGNVSRHCGGGSTGESGISAGFFLSGKIGTAGAANIAISTGYKEDGSNRLAPVPGFLIVGSSRAITLAGCIARDGRGYGLEVRVIDGTVMDTVTIGSFASYDNAEGHVLIDVRATATLNNIILDAPILRSTTNAGYGVRVIQGDADSLPVNFQINGGEIVGPGKATSTQAGFYTNATSLPKWAIRGVLFSGWQTGIHLVSGSIGDKEVGNTASIAGCHFDDCTTGVSMGIDAGKYAMLEGCTFTGCTNNVSNTSRIITSAVSFGQDPANPAKKVWQFYRSAVPTDGSWTFGTVCYLSNSGPGAHVGARVTNAAGAGTWTRFGGLRDTAAAIASPAGGATVDAEARAAIASILTALRANATIAP